MQINNVNNSFDRISILFNMLLLRVALKNDTSD